MNVNMGSHDMSIGGCSPYLLCKTMGETLGWLDMVWGIIFLKFMGLRSDELIALGFTCWHLADKDKYLAITWEMNKDPILSLLPSLITNLLAMTISDYKIISLLIN